MNKLFCYLFSALVLIISLPAFAIVEVPCNIGVVDVEIVWHKSVFIQDLNGKISSMDKDISDKMKKLEQRNKNEEAILLLKKKSNPKKKEILRQLEELKKRNLDLQRSISESKARMNQICIKAERKFYPIMKDVIEEIAKEKKLCVVLPEKFILFHSEKINITNLVLERLDKRTISMDINALEDDQH